MAVVFGTLAGALGALSLRPITQPRTAALLSQLDAGRDAGVPDGGDAQAPMLIVWVEDVRWQPPRDYPPFDRRAAAAALEAAATGMAERCDLADSELHAPAAITFAPSGIVVRAEVGGALTESDRRACVERWLELAEMPPFAAPARELRRTVDMR